MMLIVPAIGASNEELLQDTLKSMCVAGFALAAGFAFFGQKSAQPGIVQIHPLFFLSLVLVTYALTSMFW